MEYTEKELQQEVWRDVDGYEGMYQVSDLGRVRSRKSGEWKVLRPVNNGKGYLIVNLCKDGVMKTYRIHRLVAQAFIDNTDSSKTLINHIDECKQNNRVSNLEYCTALYNNTYNDIHYRRITKFDKIKSLYRPDLSIKENIELFKANGIECSRPTVWKLRKDLGIARKCAKRNNYFDIRPKVKNLYNPNLTYAENLEIFRANGIECSERVIFDIRRDLGLTKKYNRNQ